ncbi:pyruvate ferredoxin oxidoreductase [Sporomusa sp. KB1]|jgi:pyruvate ferredoxin oxidoreductase alpha subunit|uniref:pyruvate ferredoxin oxidoreductase n=1 Tax=Sporomusa sp. KB1 TaxID=943346 RepID=UPI0011A3F33C|nr:pyruvate ferredoxin oxidoreductase [Sporomusa sp. KB1]TWH51900.1 pyruvate ferredoxin oxidoreductase alpha subunit [Sporomusa sp. KB1]
MSIRERLSGNEAVAHAMKQINPDVVAAFPITPSTEVPQYFSQYVADGIVDTEFVPVESEHSAISACVGSQAAGARTMTATSSCGLALMHEILYVAASNRLPITMAAINRALSGPININADHSDTMGSRDSGWIQIYSETNQEAYDNFIQAVRIAEHKDVRLPIMVCQDGFITSHAVENIELIEDEKVKEFVGEYEPENYLLNEKQPMSVGPYDTPAYYMEHKRLQAEGMRKAKEIALEVAAEFEKISGRRYELFEKYKLEDAEVAIVVINSMAGTAKDAIDQLRNDGKKAGLLKIRLFRPFPAEEIAEALKHIKVLAVMDRSESFSNQGGPLGAEIKAALYHIEKAPIIINYIYGLGGRDIKVEDVNSVYKSLLSIMSTGITGETYRYLSVRNEEEK